MSAPAAVAGQEPWYLRFHDLMPLRVREVLLVSSAFDAFILEEDGRLTERIFSEYSELNLSWVPRITHVATGESALALLEERSFDMLLTVARLKDMAVAALARAVKWRHPRLPVVALALRENERGAFTAQGAGDSIDHVFLWSGDTRILLTACKLVEDQANVEHDTRVGGVQVIIVVEDSLHRYSSFLTLLYTELMSQSQSLVAEGVNALHKLLRMRARPKVLLATSYEEAIDAYRRYRDHVVAVISDVSFPHAGVQDDRAGFELVSEVLRAEPNLAVLLQSANPKNAPRAVELGVEFVDKNSPELLRRIARFLQRRLGFGDFVFCTPDGVEVGRARDTYEMAQVLETVPAESIAFHSDHQDFSMWLSARTMFRLADKVRPRSVADFGGVEGLRRHLIEVLDVARRQEREGAITDFAAGQAARESRFVRLGRGSLGGKARGLAFANAQLTRYGLGERFPGLDVHIPRTVAVAIDAFEQFIDENQLADVTTGDESDARLLERFLAGALPARLREQLRETCAGMRRPLAVRSSALLEDSYLEPFAGIYATRMLPNVHPDPDVRFEQLCRAVKAVYASTYFKDARAYAVRTGHSVEEERMGVVIQEVVGSRHGSRYYPLVSGVARSVNFYPPAGRRADDGVVLLALGLGHIVVGGEISFCFTPGASGVLPQFPTPREFVQNGQARFYAVDMTQPLVSFDAGGETSLVTAGLEEAEDDGTLAHVGSVFLPDEDRLRDSLAHPGPRVISFNNILRWKAFPLEEAVGELLRLFADGMGGPVEIEFAVYMPELDGQGDTRPPHLHLLQVRYQAGQAVQGVVDVRAHEPSELLCRTDRSLGHGVIDEIQDIVFVDPDGLDHRSTARAAQQVGDLNAGLTAARRPYLLVGPGRFGASDPSMGLPVRWSQIAGARVIVETPFVDRAVEPSQGSHFFHNLTAFQVGYLTLAADSGRAASGERTFDTAWLKRQPVASRTEHVRHVQLESPLRVFLDGRSGRASILKPAG